MEKIKIDNPAQNINSKIDWNQFKSHVQNVINTFPRENALISIDDEKETIVFLKKSINPQANAILKDQIIYATNVGNGSYKLEITNEDGQISSYNELERDKTTLDITVKLIVKSINGTLIQSVQNVNNKANNEKATKGIIQLILAIVAIAAIVMGLKGLFL